MKTRILIAIAFSGIQLSSTAQQLEWVTPYVGNASTSTVYGFFNCIEPSGEHVFSGGEFTGTVNFDPGVSNYSLTANHSWYLTKTSNAGQFVWARAFNVPYAAEVEVDAAGNSYLSGVFSSTFDADPGAGVSMLSTGGADNANFLIKLDPAGGFVWAQCIGGASDFQNSAMAIRSNALYFTSAFSGQVDFDNGPGVHELTASDYGDIFVLKMTTDGEFQWVERFGATNNSSENSEAPIDIVVGSTGDVFLTGMFTRPGDFNSQTGISLLAPLHESDAFLMKLNDQGEFQWAIRSGNETENAGKKLAAGPDESVYQIGGSNSLNQDTGTNDDFFVARYSSLGAEMWRYQIGGESMEQGIGMTVDAAGSVYVSGDHSSLVVDFDPGPGEVLLNSDYSIKSYLMKFHPAGDLAWAKSFDGDVSSIWSLDYFNGNIYCTGYFVHSFDADAGSGVHLLNSDDTFISGFIMKLDTAEVIDVTGIGETTLIPFQLYPNPAIDVTTIHTEQWIAGSTVTLYNLQGDIVLRRELQVTDTEISVDELPAGTYLMEVQQNGSKSTRRLVKR